MASMLIANGLRHDASKFEGIEWLYLNEDTKSTNPHLFDIALDHHQRTNLHHSEAWPGGILSMSSLYLAEMTADWSARSQEKNTDFWDWVHNFALERYKFTTGSKTYTEIYYYRKILENNKT